MEALQRLLPKAIAVIEGHLESGRPDAWRSAHKVWEYTFGRPDTDVNIALPMEDDVDLCSLTDEQLNELKLRLRAQMQLDGARALPAG